MSAPSVRSPHAEALLESIACRDSRDDDYWEEISVLGKEVAASAPIRTIIVARCVRELERASGPVIVRMLDVLEHLEEPIVKRAIVLASHADETVRFAIVSVLEDNRSADAIATLAALSSDESLMVRSAAVRAIVRGLGVPSESDFVDTFVVRDALAKCLGDDLAVHDEAVLGLAMRRDPRALAPLAASLAEEATGQRIDAAYYFASPDLRDVLQRHLDAGSDAGGAWSLEEAIGACA